MRIALEIATPSDVPGIVSLRIGVAQQLTAQYGKGPWSSGLTDKGVLFEMRRSTVYVARRGNNLVGTVALSTRKPWAIDKSYFSPSQRPLYLTAMAVAPDKQRQGIGRLCIDAVRRVAVKWPSDALRLDAFDAEAGAGGFYRKCGFREVGRATYRNCPLVYFEMQL